MHADPIAALSHVVRLNSHVAYACAKEKQQPCCPKKQYLLSSLSVKAHTIIKPRDPHLPTLALRNKYE